MHRCFAGIMRLETRRPALAASRNRKYKGKKQACSPSAQVSGRSQK
jgi:hypothetical protein